MSSSHARALAHTHNTFLINVLRGEGLDPRTDRVPCSSAHAWGCAGLREPCVVPPGPASCLQSASLKSSWTPALLREPLQSQCAEPLGVTPTVTTWPDLCCGGQARGGGGGDKQPLLTTNPSRCLCCLTLWLFCKKVCRGPQCSAFTSGNVWEQGAQFCLFGETDRQNERGNKSMPARKCVVGWCWIWLGWGNWEIFPVFVS